MHVLLALQGQYERGNPNREARMWTILKRSNYSYVFNPARVCLLVVCELVSSSATLLGSRSRGVFEM